MKTRNQLHQEQSLHFYKRSEEYRKKYKESEDHPTFNTPDTSSPLLTSLLDEPTLSSPSATRAPPKRLPRKIKELHEKPGQYLYEAPRSKKIKTPDYHHSSLFVETPPVKVSYYEASLILFQKPQTSPPGSIKRDYRDHNSHRFTRFSGNISESIFNTGRLFRASDELTLQDEKREGFPVSPRKPHAFCLSVWEHGESLTGKKAQKEPQISIVEKYRVID